MPTYQYRCRECGADLEAVQKFTDDALTTCPACGQESLRKVYNAVGVHFKGSGFYRTDSRTGSGSAKQTGSAAASDAKPASSERSSSTKSDSSSKPSTPAPSTAP